MFLTKLKKELTLYFVPFNIYKYANIICILYYIIVISWYLFLALNNNGIVNNNEPFGADFISFYSASKLSLLGNPELAYDRIAHEQMQKAVIGNNIGYFAFFYPPIFLFLCLGFGVFPYMVSVNLWILIGLTFYTTIVKRLSEGNISFIVLAGFGGVFISILSGQNSFFTTGLIGAAILFSPSRPFLAGLMLGLLSFKPHLGILIPFVLAAAGLWRIFISASVTVIVLICASFAYFGLETWQAFLANAPLAVLALENDIIGNERMHSLFGASRLLGAPLWFSYSLQGMSALFALLINVYFAYKLKKFILLAPLMACGLLMITPFILTYDLTMLAIPLIWLYNKAQVNGYLFLEKEIMLLAYSIPMFANFFASDLLLPIAPLIVIAIFILVVRRLQHELNPS